MSSSTPIPRTDGLLRRQLARLPQGKTLPPEVWRTRHRAMLAVVWAHLVAFAIAGLIIHQSAGALTYELLPIAVCALAGALPTGGRRLRGSMVAFAALYCSAALVNMTNGATEAHFHFFLMVTMLAAYEEWVPYLLAIAFVLVHHLVVGVVDPRAVYNDSTAIAHPWTWALIHSGFILGLCVINVVSWRLNEDSRAEAAAAHERTRESEAEFRDAFEGAPIGMALADLDGRFDRVNHALSELTGFDHERLLSMNLSEIVQASSDQLVGADSFVTPAFECPLNHADGSTGWCLLQRTLARDSQGAPSHVLVQLLDLSTRREAEQRLAHAAEHDGLTGLLTRDSFIRSVDQAIAALTTGDSLALLFVDIDNFKGVNDSLGHGAGDRLLQLVATRLRAVLRPSDVLARFGGDEFVILLHDTDRRRAVTTASLLRTELAAPAELEGQRRFVTASVGLRLSDSTDDTAEQLIRDGDSAMYRAKVAGKDSHVLFDESLREEADRRYELEEGLGAALELDQFELHYQPEIDLVSGEMFGVEALIRWRRGDGTLVPPNDFIPLAERSGQIVAIGRWVLDQACRQASEWVAQGLLSVDALMSVNLSQVQLTHGDIVADVAAALHRHRLVASSLCIEITESSVMLDRERAIAALTGLKTLGVKLAIDDFGTGYSSLSHLKHLMPVDILKIDRSFVQGLGVDTDDFAIVTAVIELAQKLGLTTVAEGIEQDDQANFLRAMHCSVGQGFGLGRPEPAERLTALLLGDQLQRAA